MKHCSLHTLPVLLAMTIAAVAAATSSCSDGSCADLQSAMPLARLVTSGTTTAVTPAALTARGIGAVGADSLLADNATQSDLYLPLRAADTLCAFELTLNTATTDTITVFYRARPYFADAECGAMYVFALDSVRATTHGIDSVERVVRETTNSAQVALRIHIPADTTL